MKQTLKKAARVKSQSTHYMNVDLDIFSHVSLRGLVDALGDEVFVLYIGGKGRRHEAHVELASSHMGMTADRTIIGLAGLVKRLSPRFRKVWHSAKSREFNVGIEAGLEPHSYEVRLHRRTVDAIAEVGGTLVVTVYAAVLEETGVPRIRQVPAAGKTPRS